MMNIPSSASASPLRVALARSIFNDMDSDKNGAISKAEFQAALRLPPGEVGARKAAEKFRMLDANQDGMLTEHEVLDGLDKMLFWMRGLDALAESGIIDPLAPFQRKSTPGG